jgi:hypothetical protein
MKINPLDAHDRLLHFTKQQFNISETCQDIINKRPFGDHPFYIFAHTRIHDDGVSTRLIWQPRLTKPKAQTNSMLFKVYPGKDIVKIIWMIPKRELWESFQKNKMTANETITKSIYLFTNQRQLLDAPEDDDYNDEKINQIYKEISISANKPKFKMI